MANRTGKEGDLNSAIEAYLAAGGAITQCPPRRSSDDGVYVFLQGKINRKIRIGEVDAELPNDFSLAVSGVSKPVTVPYNLADLFKLRKSYRFQARFNRTQQSYTVTGRPQLIASK